MYVGEMSDNGGTVNKVISASAPVQVFPTLSRSDNKASFLFMYIHMKITQISVAFLGNYVVR
jgi:hypothetical protein